jgi:hypothetical protein
MEGWMTKLLDSRIVRTRIMRSVPLALAAALAAAGCAVAGASPETPAVPAAAPLRVVVISDLNGAYGSTEYEPRVHRTVRRIVEDWRPDLVIAAGDLIAGQQPSLPDSTVAAMWSAFDTAVGRPLRDAAIPFAPTIGNHDGSRYPAHARDRRFALDYWTTPAHTPALDFVDAEDFPFNYAFRMGDLFVLVWDASNEEIARLPAQLEWIEATLSSPEARRAATRIVLGHLPLHAVAEGRDRPGEVLAEPDSLRAILEKHDVRMYVSGHHHAYYPGRRGALEMLHTGALGQGARPLIGSSEAPYSTVTTLEIAPAGGPIGLSTYRLSEDGEMLSDLPLPALPERVDGFNGPVIRRDLR